MLKMIVPLVLMLMPFHTAQAFDPNFLPPGYTPYSDGPPVTCQYSFFVGRYRIQITDAAGDKHVCEYIGNREEQYVYKCASDDEVLVKSTWAGVESVQFVSTPFLSAFCN